MECNRDEAIRSKTIAEGKLSERDYVAAKKFALKAQTLYPGLEGISQMLTTLDVYISAANKISGEVDWYGILGVSHMADDETVRKQYRKLALLLHPDKNKSVGADGAFKLLSEAWSLLSDKAKRLAYNQRRSSRGFQQKVPTQSGGPSAPPPSANGNHNFKTKVTSNPKPPNNTARAHSTPVPPRSYGRSDTFWTICNKCKMHYEYLKMYLNHTLLCPNCQEPFLASEMAPPFTAHRQVHQNSSNQVPGSNPRSHPIHSGRNSGPGGSAGLNSFKHTNIQQGTFSRTAGFGSTEPSIAAKAAHVVQQANEKLKRERDGSQAAARWEKHLKQRRGLDDGSYRYGGNTPYQTAVGSGGGGTGSVLGFSGSGLQTDRSHNVRSITSKNNSRRELTPLETRNMLMEKARTAICKKLNEWRSETATKAAETEKEKVKGGSKKEKEKRAVKVHVQDLKETSESPATKTRDQASKCPAGVDADVTNKVDLAPMSMNVPDSDFHDFDLDRMESSFDANQIWAAYDDDDGMPRFYAMIHKVISRKPFQMRISWLNSKTNSEFGPIEWIGSGFYKTCGEFRSGRMEINKSLNSFSHKVKWTKDEGGNVHIYPQKGDVWALYRNWSHDWNEHTPDEVIHKYDMVEVLNDYNEEQGVSVAPLLKVFGYKTVFIRYSDPDKIKRIPKEEMFRFSHQVPNYMLTGQEDPNAPKNCQELDPAATPLELIQVKTAVNDVKMKPNGGNVVEELLHNCPRTRVDENFGGGAKQAKEEEDVLNCE